ncbi:TraB/GumN family protein [Aquiflexum lacus]|uniref:hypothetical protein n=1 Tax=Aquiflexum lacus TaxID=2483805 RepID=UPI001894E3CF|nr:hypothetical protein [Aquiflexum lacus]
MVKKFFKFAFKLVLAISLLSAIGYGAFHLWEYSTGKEYIDYLTENSETIPINESFSYRNIADDISKSKVILVGEVHGVSEPSKFDVDFFIYLHKNHGVRHYIAELDFVQATLLNEFMKNGNADLLQKILKKWVVIQGRNNQDYLDKYFNLQKFYSSLPEDEKFEFIGIDATQDWNLVFDYLKAMSATPEKINPEDYTVLSLLEELTENNDSQDTLAILSHLRKNLDYVTDKIDREEIMFKNFQYHYTTNKLVDQKLYGFFGLAHVFQYRVNGRDPLASKIRKSDLELTDKILSINFMFTDSYMVWPSNQLPSFMQDDGAYTKMSLSADNMLLVYVVGVKDFKRMTPNHHKSLVKMNSPNAPYSNSIRLNKVIQILPFAGKTELNDKGKPYVQYTVFVRNSDWATPIK